MKVGTTVKKGDPLAEVFSTEVAKAKNDYLVKNVQWQHDLKLKNLRRSFYEDVKAISEQPWVDTQNDEQKSRLDFQLVHDKLAVTFELKEEELAVILDGDGNGTPKGRCILRSPVSGTIVRVNTQIQDLADPKTTLMEIATMKKPLGIPDSGTVTRSPYSAKGCIPPSYPPRLTFGPRDSAAAGRFRYADEGLCPERNVRKTEKLARLGRFFRGILDCQMEGTPRIAHRV